MGKKAILTAAVLLAWFGGLYWIGQPADGIVRKEAPWHWAYTVMVASAGLIILGIIVYAILEGNGRKKSTR